MRGFRVIACRFPSSPVRSSGHLVGFGVPGFFSPPPFCVEFCPLDFYRTLRALPEKPLLEEATNRQMWTAWQTGLSKRITLSEKLPPLRMLLIWDNLQGHYTPEMVLWLFAHGVMPLYTPLGGSWLNMAESIQRIIVRRALDGQNLETPEQIITWLEAVARGWDDDPTPFEWGGARAARRERSRVRRHALGGSGACCRRSIRPKRNLVQKWQSSCQSTH